MTKHRDGRSSASVAQRPPSRRRRPKRRPTQPKATYVLAGSSMLAVLGLLVDFGAVFQPPQPQDICTQQVQAQSVLSRDELAQLLSIPERDVKENVRSVISEPYCLMPPIEIRAGVMADREAYPLEFDPQTWLVILYEGNEYAGYAFSFQK